MSKKIVAEIVKSLRIPLGMSIAMALVLLSGTAAKAQVIDFTLTSPAYQTAAPGAIVAFDAIVSDADPSADVYLNSDSTSGALTVDAGPFSSFLFFWVRLSCRMCRA